MIQPPGVSGQRIHAIRPVTLAVKYGAMVAYTVYACSGCRSSIVLCSVWLITESCWLTLVVMILKLLHLAKEVPAAEVVIVQSPLLWLCRDSSLISMGIFSFVLAN